MVLLLELFEEHGVLLLLPPTHAVMSERRRTCLRLTSAELDPLAASAQLDDMMWNQ